MTTYALGDVHGRAPALIEVLDKSNFNDATDTLIVLGDIVDGYPWIRECFDILDGIKNKVICSGNHDLWWLNWCNTSKELPVWVHQGGYATLRSYDFDNKNVPESHVKMIENAKIYHVDSQHNLYCHGGFNARAPIENQDDEFIMWDRTLCKYAHDRWIQKNPVDIKPYKKIFIGHTSTMFFHSTRPLIMGNVVMLDTGGGDVGKLTIMNVDTLEYWQSEKKTKVDNRDLYKEFEVLK
jgi:serine/threonine protein phosphatase 1